MRKDHGTLCVHDVNTSRAVNDSKPSISEPEMLYRALRLLEGNSRMSQRELAGQLSISVGKANRCVRALIKRGLMMASHGRNRADYQYLLTPRGLRERARLTEHFLAQKMAEYERLGMEIECMRREAAGR